MLRRSRLAPRDRRSQHYLDCAANEVVADAVKCGDAMLRSYLYEAANVLLTRVAKWSVLKAFLNEVLASLSVSPSRVITAFVHARASAAHPRLRMTR